MREEALGLIRLSAAAAAVAVAALAAADARATPLPVRQISSDVFTNPDANHATEVEPDTFAAGDTIVAVFQAGRFADGGSTAIGFATSSDDGATWTNGWLPSLTKATTPAGPLDRASDPSIAYDAAHGVWLAATLGLMQPPAGPATSISVSRSADGRVWGPPITVVPATAAGVDKEWVVCDNDAASPFRGRCYVSYTDFTTKRRITTRASSDGGLSWGPPVTSPDDTTVGIGTQPVVQPDGTLVIPFLGDDDTLASIRSLDGGATFQSRVAIAQVTAHEPPILRADDLPSAETDGSGRIFVAWYDCRFRANCVPPTDQIPPNDIVYSTSSDGVAWSAPARVPIDPVTSGIDHVTPGLGVDARTDGDAARLALAYYTIANEPCTIETCAVSAGLIESQDGGRSWSAAVPLDHPPMSLSWLPNTRSGRMLGDYISTSFAGDRSVSALALAAAPANGVLAEAIYAVVNQSGTIAPPTSPPPPSPELVTISVSKKIVVYGSRVVLSGTISSAAAGETVAVEGEGTVTTSAGGAWRLVAKPRASTAYRARWRDAVSAPADVGVRPHILLTRYGGRFFIRAVAAESFAGKIAFLQRRGRTRWKTIAKTALDARSAAFVRARLPHGRSLLRVVLPARQTAPSYLPGYSKPLRVRR